MSSAGMLATGQYTIDTVQMARRHPEFVFGFIAQERVEKLTPEGERLEDKEDFLVMTPGVGMVSNKQGDKLGQQYRTPRQVVYESGCDVIIVGRGIYGGAGEKEWKEEAERYRAEGWKAYEDRVRDGQQATQVRGQLKRMESMGVAGADVAAPAGAF
jgi:orotidine-5'-phosphate decarboxylase